MSACRVDELEAHLRGELDDAQTRAVAEHLGGCPQCQKELRWLRAERRLFSERAREHTPARVQLAPLRSAVDARLVQRARAKKRERAARSGGAVLSAVAAAVCAFFVASWSSSPREAQLVWLDPNTCSSLDADASTSQGEAFCPGPLPGTELAAMAERLFDACLVATPHALPGGGICR